jgi:hypothetical protein
VYPFLYGSTKEFRTGGLKRGLVGGFLANAMPASHLHGFLQNFTS